MKLTNKDKAFLKSYGVDESDFSTIESAGRKTKYEMFETNNESIVTTITQKKAIEILGREKYLIGLFRSAFHSSAVRLNDDDTICVVFDSSKFWGSVFRKN